MILMSEHRFTHDDKAKVVCGGDEIRGTINYIFSLEKELKRIRLISYALENVRVIGDTILEEFLYKLALKGVMISVVIGQMPAKEVKKVLLKLRRFGINIYYNRRAHAKIILVEGKGKNYAIIMSANITHGGLYYNYEAGVSLKLSEDVYMKLREYTNDILGNEETVDLVYLNE